MEKPPGRRRALEASLLSLCGGALALNLFLVAALVAILAAGGLGTFWPKDLVRLALADGRTWLGEVWDREAIPELDGAEAPPARRMRERLKVGNRDLTGTEFVWIEEADVVERTRPVDAALFERLEWGNFYGGLVEIRRGEAVLAATSEAAWEALPPLLAEKRGLRERIEDLEKGEIGGVNAAIEGLRLRRRRIELDAPPPAERARLEAEIDRLVAAEESRYEALVERLQDLRSRLLAETVVVEAAGGARQAIPAGGIVRAVRPNRMGLLDKARLYAARVGSFLSEDPRESNTEGGVFPAIVGTVGMVFLMAFALMPFGVLAALYLREYAREGPLLRVVRIAVHNLAGVPSIVFGLFGLGFFVYFVGGTVDRFFHPEALPTPTFGAGGILWASLTLALLTVPVVIVAAEEGLAAVPREVREGSLALGATKFETTWRVVLPAAGPGILTGMILAMARAAGEVAPLMLVGVVKLAPTLPIDGNFPFFHPERKFMHLGFHIYDVGFQSPNVEAAKPQAFATALLLLLVVLAMNLVAIAIRNRLRRKYASHVV